MADNFSCTVYIGNLDERVTDRVLYDILIQAGRVMNLHIPRDKETDKPRGFAFAEYETEETAEYAVKLFSGLVVLYKKTLKFAVSGQYQGNKNKPSANFPTSTTSSIKPPRPLTVTTTFNEEKFLNRPNLVNHNMIILGISPNSKGLSTSCRVQEHQATHRSNYDYKNNNNKIYDYGPRVFGTTKMDPHIIHTRLGRYGIGNSSNHYAPY